MASKCYYLNVFYTLLILYAFTAGTLSDSDERFITYDLDVPDLTTYYTHTFVPLERSVRQAGTPPEKKNEAPSADKSKTTKKPTAMDAKPTNTPADADQKPKTAVKKESLSTKITGTTPPTDTHEVHTHEEHEGESEATHTHADDVHTDGMPVNNATTNNTVTKAPPKKISGPPSSNVTVPDGEIAVDKFLEMDLNGVELNETLRDHNIKNQSVDSHLYYNSSILHNADVFQHYWVDMDKQKDVKEILSNSHRKAVTVKLNFDFKFYGHPIKKIIIATGGFLYTGEYVHSWLSVTQYIAPLMADFDTASSNYSSIKYVDNGTAFTVQWENVVLMNKPEEGSFTFQCTLFKNGDIVFAYKNISVVIDNTAASQHPIKVGVSDAYIIDRIIFLVRRKTIFEYHRVNMERDEIRNGTVILLKALATCLDMNNCQSCVTEIPHFECNWCANRCSNGMDRLRQDWLGNGCNSKKRKSVDECIAEEKAEEALSNAPKSSEMQYPEDDNNVNVGIAGIMGILFVVCLALGIGVWLFYAYRNPHTPAGQFLIRYRPSQWSWRRGEARYTAATIHM